MINISKISKNLIGVSLISSLMVFWLGSRFLSDAHSQFSGARELQRSAAPEATLFEVANSLDRERAATQQILISSGQFEDGLSKLDLLSKNTRKLVDQAREEIERARNKASGRAQQRYDRSSIEALFEDLEDKLERLSYSSSVLVGETYKPHAERSESIQLQLFDFYGRIINVVDHLRKRTHSFPEKSYIGVLAAHDIKDSIWDLSNSIYETTTLVESYLLKNQHSALNTLNKENFAFRVLHQDERTNQALLDLTDMVQGRANAGVSVDALELLRSQHDSGFRSHLIRLLESSSRNTEPPFNLEEWNEISMQSREQIRILKNAALSNTLSTADAIKNRAAVSLIFNILIVLLCLLMAYATFRIARKVQHQANHDELTNLPNRRHFNTSLETLFKKTDVAKGERLVLMTLDLNGFKHINDTMGHFAGDRLLAQVADRLVCEICKDMIIARMGGDEFAIAYRLNEPGSPHQFALQLSNIFGKPFEFQEGRFKIDTCIGYSVYPDDAATLGELQHTSDFAMFSAKKIGNQAIQPYDRDIAYKLEYRNHIEKDLSTAIENNELELYYQPQFNLALNQIDAVEALVRWNHPERGTVPPDSFIGIAEETGLMPAIGNWVLNEACRQAAEWHTSGLSIRVAVNVSVHDIMQSQFEENVMHTLERHKLSTSLLELEVTESVVMADIQRIIDCLQSLQKHGIRIALDDFGTGYSSLNHLHELPLDTLKIDRAFIARLDDDAPSMKSVIETIASIANIYGLETVAEGIESENQLSEIKKLGIDIAQGYYYSKPLPKHELIDSIHSINELANNNRKAA